MPEVHTNTPEVAIEPIPAREAFSTFLENCPPGKQYSLAAAGLPNPQGSYFSIPPIQLHCDSPQCGGVRYFDTATKQLLLHDTNWNYVFLNYACRHCKVTTKAYALMIRLQRGTTPTEAVKFGEWPIFAPHVPSRVLSMVGRDQELFLKGRRAESLGMGIAAFAYYRRVVENQKSRLIVQIVTVARRIKADPNVILRLETAKDETQFTAAVEMIKDAIPEVLRIDGHNPLTLLHSALSEGLHAQTDDECLELATSIRVLLSELCDRISTALKDHAELQSALSRLLKRDQSKNSTMAKQ